MTGVAWIAGAGPWDPDLATVGLMRRLREAQVVIYDRLANPRLLEEVPPDAELIDAGKSAGRHTLTQEEINELLVDRVRRGKTVVRLKGGDPFVFGRGGEEAEALAEAGLAFGVIPGVTSVIAAPAYAGIPVTHRGLASSFAVVTGHEDPAKAASSIDWPSLARGVDTLVLLMGVQSLPAIAAELVAAGRHPQTPAAVIERGTSTAQRTVTATLGSIVEAVRQAGIQPPAITVIGDVVSLRERIAWFDRRSLFGRRVLVTRTRHQASRLVSLLEEEGAETIELPAIELEERADEEALAAAVQRLVAGEYRWAVFTSANGVDALFRGLEGHGLDARAFGQTRVAAIGAATAEALAWRGIRADLVPPEFIAESLASELVQAGAGGGRVLLPRAEGAREELPRFLEEAGATADELTLYLARTPVEPEGAALERVRAGEVDAVTLASSSTARGLHDLLQGDLAPLQRAIVACIGPVTADTARSLGFRVDAVAGEHTVHGLVAALKSAFENAQEKNRSS